jgi:hypothetical protein
MTPARHRVCLTVDHDQIQPPDHQLALADPTDTFAGARWFLAAYSDQDQSRSLTLSEVVTASPDDRDRAVAQHLLAMECCRAEIIRRQVVRSQNHQHAEAQNIGRLTEVYTVMAADLRDLYLGERLNGELAPSVVA